MSTKNVSLREDVYNKLKELKRPYESFSDVIEKLTVCSVLGSSNVSLQQYLS